MSSEHSPPPVIKKRLIESTAVVSAMTLVSRILGFARDIIIAHMVGATAMADAFFVANRIPNFLRRLFGEGAFSQAFVPVLSDYKVNRTSEVRDLVNHVSGVLAVVLLLVTVVAVIAAPIVVLVVAPGFWGQPTKYELTVEMIRITFPYLFFICLTAFAGGILNSYGRFGVPAFTPVILNLSMIAAALFLAPHLEQPVVALAWGVFAGGVLQLAFQLPYLKRLGLLPRPRFRRAHDGVRRILKLMGPAVLGVSVSQINLLLDTLLASFLITGSVSWLYYSDRMLEFPLGVFGIAVATVVLPSLSQDHARKSPGQFRHTLDWAVRVVMLVGFPAAVGMFVLAAPILTTLFQYGEFSHHDVTMAASSLQAYTPALLGAMLVKVLAPGFFSREDTATPVRIGIIAMVSNMIFNLCLIFPLGHVGLALATSLSAGLNALLLYRGLARADVFRVQSGTVWYLARVVIAGLVMGAVIWFGVASGPNWIDAGVLERIWRLGLWIVVGMTVYFVALSLLGVGVIGSLRRQLAKD